MEAADDRIRPVTDHDPSEGHGLVGGRELEHGIQPVE